MNETIGFVGVGRMGSRMAENLLDEGYQVVVHDVDDERVAAMVEKGAERARSVTDLASSATVVMTSLPTSEIVTSVYFGEDGLVDVVDEDTLLVEMSTIEPRIVERIAEAADGAVVDSPVIGPPPEADAGTLTIVVGCDDAILGRVTPILDVLSSRLDHVGDVGVAKRIKLANNVMTYGNFAIAAEMVALVDEMGIDREQFFDITSSGAASSAIADAKLPKAFDGDSDPGFTVDGARTDLQYALAMKEEADFSASLASAIADRFTLTASVADGEMDYSVMAHAHSDLRE